LSEKDQLMVFFHKCKTNNTNGVIAITFGFNARLVSTIFQHVMTVFYDFAKDNIWWLTQEQNKKLMPRSFKKNFPNTIVIFDCAEVKTESPQKLDNAVWLYSQYKHSHTIKFLIGISPCGLINFVSRGYGGRTSDAQIVAGSGALKKLKKGDGVMVDKGRSF
jgi:hypothetical protein